MEAIYLQSMTDFITWVDEKRNGNGGHYDIIIRYKNFLKQPLKLEMFVPCDEDGNILKEPKRWNDYLQFPDSFDGNKEWGELYNYELAKERVLFKCFSIRTENKRKYVSMEGYEIERSLLSGHKMTIEDLANDWSHIELTETAIKQIGL